MRLCGPESPRWKGGRVIAANGYVLIYHQDHPRTCKGKGLGYVAEHVLVVERALGHYIDRRHPIHHVDENPANNANKNLVACEDNAYHMLLHQRQRALDACGNANALPCKYCGTYERQDEIATVVRRNRKTGRIAYHRDCHARYALELYHKRRAS